MKHPSRKRDGEAGERQDGGTWALTIAVRCVITPMVLRLLRGSTAARTL